MNKEDEDLTLAEKIIIILLWFREYQYRTELKEEGYIKKYRNRKICVIIGIALYAFIFLVLRFCISEQ